MGDVPDLLMPLGVASWARRGCGERLCCMPCWVVRREERPRAGVRSTAKGDRIQGSKRKTSRVVEEDMPPEMTHGRMGTDAWSSLERAEPKGVVTTAGD